MFNRVAKLAHPPQRPSALLGWGLAAVAGVAIAGCRPSPPPTAVAPTPPPTVPPGSAPEPPTPVAPDTTPAARAATLPDTLIHEWQPLSNVLLTFGTMTVTPDQVQWSSGQASPYTLLSREDGYLLRLESSPSFYDTQNQYIKLIPETDASGATTSIEVAFYTGEAQLQSDEYIMYGSYFAE